MIAFRLIISCFQVHYNNKEKKIVKEIENVKIIAACTLKDLEEQINDHLKEYYIHEIKPIDDPNGYSVMLITYKSEEQ